MSRQRSAAQQLIRQLAETAAPIYLVDDRRVIVYCNPACAAWAKVAEDELIGQTCVYGPPDVDAAPAGQATAALAAVTSAVAAARLCPPPSALAGMRVRGHVSAIDAAGKLVFREAEFRPLSAEALPLDAASDAQGAPANATGATSSASLPAGVLVLVDAVDLNRPPSTSADPTADQLHAELTRWRHRMAGRYALDRMVGSSPAAARVRAQVALAAVAPATVLITGPAGSGKQHVARAIHYRRPAEAIGNLVPIACASLGAEQTVSALHALVRAEPDDPTRRPTLLLSNIDSLPLESQQAVVQQLGWLTGYRVIATAASPPAELVAEGKMRGDLVAALTTLSIELPRLSERIEDLPLLAQLFLEDVNALASRQVAGFTPEALDLLSAYAWPGNLDELADVVRQSHERAGEAEIGPRDLPRQIHLAAGAAERPPRRERPIDLEQLLAQIETELIERALAEAKGNKTRAAQLLGLTRPKLYRRLVQLGFEDDDNNSIDLA